MINGDYLCKYLDTGECNPSQTQTPECFDQDSEHFALKMVYKFFKILMKLLTST